MRVVVTGAAGFIGSAVCTELSDRGHDVVPLDALIPQAHPAGSTPAGGVARADVRDLDAMLAAVDGADVVCHQAAMVGAGLRTDDLPLYAAHNDLGTAVLLAAMATRGVRRLVLASSMVVYGEGRYVCAEHGDVDPPPRAIAALERGEYDVGCPRCGRALGWALVEESAPLRPRSSYAASKVAQEHYALAWAAQEPGAVEALRYHNVYGPGMPRDTPYSGVAAIFRSALERGAAPPVFEDGAQARDFVHVADVARANAAAVERTRSLDAGTFEPFNVCSGTPVTIGAVAQLLSAAVGGAEPVVTGDFRSGDVRHVVASPRRAEEVLGFRATVSPEEGLHEFATAPLRETA